MSTHLSNFFKQKRIALGLRLPDVARRCGYQNVSKGSNRIDRFEQTGDVHPILYVKLAAALGIDAETCDRLNGEDARQARREWLEYINTPIESHIVFRAIPGVFIGKDLPEGCETIEEMEEAASDFARRSGTLMWLIVSRKLTIRFDTDGSKMSVEEATPDHPNSPSMRLKKGRTPFLFGCTDGGGLRLRPLPQAPKIESVSNDDQ